MTHLPRLAPAVWIALLAALVMGLQEWLALSRSRLRDRWLPSRDAVTRA